MTEPATAPPETDKTPPPPSAPPPEVEPGHLPGIEAPPPSGAAPGVAALLAVIVVVLLILMATGLNQNIPYLHPATTEQVTVEGDRVTLAYLFVTNGTLDNSTTGYLCSQCPITLGEGEGFSLAVSVVNPNNATEDVLRFNTPGPFVLVTTSPSGSTPIAAGLSQPFTLGFQAPSTSGTYVVPITVSIDVG